MRLPGGRGGGLGVSRRAGAVLVRPWRRVRVAGPVPRPPARGRAMKSLKSRLKKHEAIIGGSTVGAGGAGGGEASPAARRSALAA